MNTPADLSYTDTHEWVRIENDEAVQPCLRRMRRESTAERGRVL